MGGGDTSGREVRRGLSEELTFDLEPECRGGCVCGRKCVSLLKGLDNLCSKLSDI